MSKWHNPVSTWLPLRDLRAASLTVLCYQTKSAPMRSPCVLHSPRLAISRSPSLPRIPASLLRRLSSPTLCSQTRRPNTCLQLVLRRQPPGQGQLEGSRDAERAGTFSQRLAGASLIELSKLQSLTDSDSSIRSPFT